MKDSELRLLEMLNRNNSMRLDAKRVYFGSPAVSRDRRYNTWIAVYANAEDKQYNRSTTTSYNRLDTRTIGVRSVITVKTWDLNTAANVVCTALLRDYNIPCSVDELIPRTVVKLTETSAIATYDLNGHPLVFGSLTAKLTLGAGNLIDVITSTTLTGFNDDDIKPFNLGDDLTITHLTGFTKRDVAVGSV